MNMHDGTELVFSCSPGEEALALKFSRDAPYSCFMLAFVLALPVSPMCSSAKLIATVEQRLGQLTEIGRGAALNAGEENEVSGPQQPNWAVIDFTRRGGTCKANYTTTRDCLCTTLTTMRSGLEATLEVTMLACSTIRLMTQLADIGLGPL
jgi:hypothetical protein